MDCSICKTLCSGCKYKIIFDEIVNAKTQKAKVELLKAFIDKENEEIVSR